MNSGQDRDDNMLRTCQFIDQAAQEGPDLIVLPEFFNTLYFAQYRDYKYIQWAERDDGYTMTRVRDRARQHGVYIIATIYEEESPGIYYDTAMVVDPQGQIVGKYRKNHPAAFLFLLLRLSSLPLQSCPATLAIQPLLETVHLAHYF